MYHTGLCATAVVVSTYVAYDWSEKRFLVYLATCTLMVKITEKTRPIPYV